MQSEEQIGESLLWPQVCFIWLKFKFERHQMAFVMSTACIAFILIYSFTLSDWSLTVFELQTRVLNDDLFEGPNVSLRQMDQACKCDSESFP